ncbi:MAG: nitrous oxide reductase accessory protein NosL [Proteobacteria bacterium]|nr:nitrous oxide reductase accessory protein NosL [Pseudomonadota bacterium]
MRRLAFAVVALAALSPWAFAQPAPGTPGPDARCAVCGMFVAKYTNFTAQLALADGSTAYFDGVKDLMRYYRSPATFGGKAQEVRAVFVKDYYTLESIDGRGAYYVLGSDVMGPMGRELIPFRAADAAEEFRKDHKGERVLRFEEIDDAVLAGLK